MTPALQLVDASKVFPIPGVRDVVALDHVSLSLSPGERAVVFGPNASGKSTLLKSISADQPLTSGNVFVNGTQVRELSHRALFGLVSIIYQAPSDGLAINLTVQENLALALSNTSRVNSWLPLSCRKLLAQHQGDLDTFSIGQGIELSQEIWELSGGQQQLVALAMAYLRRPDIVLLDEPTAALDVSNATRLISILTALNSEWQPALLMVSHRIEEALAIGWRTIVLNKGRIVADLTADEARRASASDIEAYWNGTLRTPKTQAS